MNKLNRAQKDKVRRFAAVADADEEVDKGCGGSAAGKVSVSDDGPEPQASAV